MSCLVVSVGGQFCHVIDLCQGTGIILRFQDPLGDCGRNMRKDALVHPFMETTPSLPDSSVRVISEGDDFNILDLYHVRG